MSKRYKYAIAAAAAILIWSCTKVETESRDDSISFHPVASKVTRAIIDSTRYPLDVPFKISAYHNGTAAYFVNDVASYITNSDNIWQTTPQEYWPLGGSLTFYAYSPASPEATMSAATGVSFADYTVNPTTDFCIAQYTEDDCANRTGSTVQLRFTHALSQVVVKIKQKQNYNAEISGKSNIVTITVNELSLKDMYVNAAFAQLPEPTWSITQSSEKDDYDFDLGNNGITLYHADAAQQIGRLLTIPQSLTGVCLHTVYTVTQTITDNTTSVSETYVVKTPVDIPLNGSMASWECGKKYIYTLSYGLDPIEIQASTTNWIPDGGEIIIEEE